MGKVLNKIYEFFKWIIKTLLIGMIVIFVFNYLGSFVNLNIPVNIYTILLIGALRIPGIAAILIYNLI